MNRLKSWIRMFFGFSRTETNAFLILLPLMFILIFIIPTYRLVSESSSTDFTKEKQQLDSIVTAWEASKIADSISKIQTFQLVNFDPNKSSAAELESIGFSAVLARRIENYRNKGGKFRTKSDLLKIYGMDTTFYKTVYTFISLPETMENSRNENATNLQEKQNSQQSKFDINLADSVQLKRIYGIGSARAARIIKYRTILGGFISTQQLHEVYGLDSAIVEEVKKNIFIADGFTPRTISINSATEKELDVHPYINYSLAKAITAYRFQHGNFSSLDELRNIQLINESTFKKIKPYLSLTP